jgi:hypothetical protein
MDYSKPQLQSHQYAPFWACAAYSRQLGKNSKLGNSDNPTYRTYPSLQPKTSQEQWNDVHRDFNSWASWGH